MPSFCKLVLDFAGQRHRLGARQINAAILQSFTVVHGDGNKPAGLGLAFVAGPLQNTDGAQLGAFLSFLGHLAGILGAGGRSRKQKPRRRVMLVW